MEAEVERSLYLKWLSDTYGKTGMEKFGEWLVTKDGRHVALDSIGFFLDPADAVNAVLYLMEGDLGNAGLSGISVLPWIGDYLGKGGKGRKYLLKAADLTKLNQKKKVIKVLDNLDVFIKARKADLKDVQKLLKDSWDYLMDGGGYAVKYATPDGMVYWVRTSDDFRVHINLMDEAGDTFQETLQAGKRVGDGGGLAEGAIKGERVTKTIYEKFTLEEIELLKNKVIKEGQLLKDMGLTNNELGPAIAGVYNKANGKFYTAINSMNGNLPEELHPLIADRIKNMPDDLLLSYAKTRGAGTHAEIYAVNKALLDYENVNVDDLLIYVNRTQGVSKPVTEIPFVTCPHCRYILEGFNILSD